MTVETWPGRLHVADLFDDAVSGCGVESRAGRIGMRRRIPDDVADIGRGEGLATSGQSSYRAVEGFTPCLVGSIVRSGHAGFLRCGAIEEGGLVGHDTRPSSAKRSRQS